MKKSFTKHIILTFVLALFASFNMQAQKAVAYPHQPLVGPEIEIQEEEPGTVKPPCVGVYPANTVWGMNGEGEFADSLGEWEADMGGISSPTDIWTWDADGVAEGQFGGADKAMASITACNGSALFDFQAYTFVDADPPVVGITQSGTLTSPTIDLSMVDNPVINWTQRYNRLNDPFATWAYSTNGGVTWSTEFDVQTANAVNAFDTHITEFMSAPVQAVANQANVKIRFTAAGDFYYWLFDDFFITNEEINDIRANDFYAIGSSYTMPASQTDIVPFLIDLENVGNTDMNNVKVNVSVVDMNSGATVHTDEFDYGTIPMGVLDENKAFPNVWTIPAGIQTTYEATYTVSADGDNNLANNTRTFPIVVSENTFSKNTPEAAQRNYWFGDTNPYYSSGVHYYMPNGNGFELVNFGWGMSPQAADPYTGFINFRIYEWDDENNDGEAEESERTLVALADQAVDDSADQYDLVIEPTPLDGSARLQFKDDTHYLIMAHYNPINAMQPGFLVRSSDRDNDPEFDPGGMQLALDTLAKAGVIGDQMRRYGSLGATGAEGSEDDVNSRIFSNLGFQAYVPLNIRLISDVNDLNNDLNVSVFPNPTTENLFVDVNLEKVTEVKIDITDLQGKVILAKTFEAVKKDRIELNVANLPTGVYNAVITTDEGYTTKKVIIE